MVSYRSSDGKQSYHPTDDLGEAIKFVEHLRNDEAVDAARIFRMEELSFEFRPYYRVEIAAAPAAPAAQPEPDTWPAPKSENENETMEGAAENPPPSTAGDDVDPLAAVWSASDRDAHHGDESVGAGMGRRGLFGR